MKPLTVIHDTGENEWCIEVREKWGRWENSRETKIAPCAPDHLEYSESSPASVRARVKAMGEAMPEEAGLRFGPEGRQGVGAEGRGISPRLVETVRQVSDLVRENGGRMRVVRHLENGNTITEVFDDESYRRITGTN